jgi:hypothetical protein
MMQVLRMHAHMIKLVFLPRTCAHKRAAATAAVAGLTAMSLKSSVNGEHASMMTCQWLSRCCVGITTSLAGIQLTGPASSRSCM